MKTKLILLLFAALLFTQLFIQLLLASNILTGKVNDALDGTFADNRKITLWNPANGISDNLTDTIGISGKSGTQNEYEFDCSLLSTPCEIGDTIKVKVFKETDNYISSDASLVISTSPESFPDLTLNSPPFPNLISPQNFANLSGSQVEFNCSAKDFDSNLKNISLFGNFSGNWQQEGVQDLSGNFASAIFNKNLNPGKYLWACVASDDLDISVFSENYSLTVDATPPIISSVISNQTSVCGTDYIRVNCTVEDSLSGVDTVIIQSQNSSDLTNYSTTKDNDIYYADILISSPGNWTFNCIANDSSGNAANKTSDNITVFPLVDLSVDSSGIFFSNPSPMENVTIKINATISNLGCSNADNILVSFFDGDPNSGGSLISEQTISSLGPFSQANITSDWKSKIGSTNIFVVTDRNNQIQEINKTNNIASSTINPNSWQIFFGNVSFEAKLGSSSFPLIHWSNYSLQDKNIYITDTEENIHWDSLQALGKTKAGEDSPSDFSTLDNFLGMQNYNDSIQKMFFIWNSPETHAFNISGKVINNVPVIPSTNNVNFKTGIIWDTTKDTDGSFSTADKEDIIFVSSINPQKPGEFGTYDYEIKIPAKLREYYTSDTSEIYMYYNLE